MRGRTIEESETVCERDRESETSERMRETTSERGGDE